MSARSRCASEVVKAALEGVRERELIHYSQMLALRWSGIDRKLLKTQPPYADCSAYATWLFWRARSIVRGNAGADIVNGESWKAGYTGTMTNLGRRHRSTTSSRLYKAGRTLCFYGNERGEIGHVAIYVGNGLVVSHGSEAGPLLLPFNYRKVLQARAYPL